MKSISSTVFFFLLAVFAWTISAPADAPAITPEQIEADWLHQDELRNAKSPARRPGGGNATAEQDAAGGVDGVKNGSWGFHTDNENDPWWQVDLGNGGRST